MSLMLGTELLLAGAAPIRPQDVFATSLYTGNGGTQTITNGLDLAGKGGLVWAFKRNGGNNHLLADTARGPNQALSTDTTEAEKSSPSYINGFTNSGFSVGVNVSLSGAPYVAWSWREARKFFVKLTYTGNGQSGRQIPHGLGIRPGVMFVKNLDAASDWAVYHQSRGNFRYLPLNQSSAEVDTPTTWNNTFPNATNFTVGNSPLTNSNGVRYVAYLFADNPEIVSIGNITSDASGQGTITHGWPGGAQFALLRIAGSSQTGDWEIFDNVRSPGWSNDLRLRANLSSAEDSVIRISDSNGAMTLTGLNASRLYLFLLIRSPT